MNDGGLLILALCELGIIGLAILALLSVIRQQRRQWNEEDLQSEVDEVVAKYEERHRE